MSRIKDYYFDQIQESSVLDLSVTLDKPEVPIHWKGCKPKANGSVKTGCKAFNHSGSTTVATKQFKAAVGASRGLPEPFGKVF